MSTDALHALSPLDGRYAKQTAELRKFFSEFALMRYRVMVEIEYLIALSGKVEQLPAFSPEEVSALRQIVEGFSDASAEEIKNIEQTTNHDVKAVEYFLRGKLENAGLKNAVEFIHFGLTSQDINNTAIPLMLKDAWAKCVAPAIDEILQRLQQLSTDWAEVPMLAYTHGQPASPTRLGKEIAVFITRIQKMLDLLTALPYAGKFGGATGNLNAHFAAYPQTDWHRFAHEFLQGLGLTRNHPTTQIDHYDDLSAWFDGVRRINVILIDLCRDIWTYISMGYFIQKTIEGEVGSSAMPHKVNPIDFENAEGNLGLANAIFDHLSNKLPVSRLQRDLTDSTVLRNVGVPLGHSLIAYKSILKGLGKLQLNEEKINADLEDNWAVVAEGIQTILRREGYPNPYDALKGLTRGKGKITQQTLHTFIDSLEVGEDVKAELRQFTPHNYVGK